MPKQRIYNMDILTGRIASVGYKIMVKPDGKRHVKDDVSSVMVAVDGRMSVSAESSIYDNRHKMYKRADISTITIKSGLTPRDCIAFPYGDGVEEGAQTEHNLGKFKNVKIYVLTRSAQFFLILFKFSPHFSPLFCYFLIIICFSNIYDSF